MLDQRSNPASNSVLRILWREKTGRGDPTSMVLCYLVLRKGDGYQCYPESRYEAWEGTGGEEWEDGAGLCVYVIQARTAPEQVSVVVYPKGILSPQPPKTSTHQDSSFPSTLWSVSALFGFCAGEVQPSPL